MIDGVFRLSPAAERMRPYRERCRRGPPCHFGRLRVSHQQHTMSLIAGVHANAISAAFCIRINRLLTLRTTRTAEPAALPAPNGPSPEAALEATLEPTKRKPNRLMMEADTTVGPRVRKTRKGLPRT